MAIELIYRGASSGGAVKSVNGKTGEVILTAEELGAATYEYVAQEIAEAQLGGGEVDLSQYALKSDIPSVEGLATEEYVDNAVNNVDIPSIEGLATEDYVNEAIAEAKLDGAEVDLSAYATKQYVDDAIADIEIPGSSGSVALDTTLTQKGKAADAKAVGDALKNVNATNIYIGDNTNTSVDDEGNVTTVEGNSSVSGGSGSGGNTSSAEWQHLATVDFADVANQSGKTSFKNLNNVTEILVKSNNVQSDNESTASSFYLSINGKQIALGILPLNKKGTAQYAWFYAKYNGLVWLSIKGGVAIADPNLNANSNVQMPYGIVFDVGAATEFAVNSANPSFIPVTGTFEVYAR